MKIRIVKKFVSPRTFVTEDEGFSKLHLWCPLLDLKSGWLFSDNRVRSKVDHLNVASDDKYIRIIETDVQSVFEVDSKLGRTFTILYFSSPMHYGQHLLSMLSAYILGPFNCLHSTAAAGAAGAEVGLVSTRRGYCIRRSATSLRALGNKHIQSIMGLVMPSAFASRIITLTSIPSLRLSNLQGTDEYKSL